MSQKALYNTEVKKRSRKELRKFIKKRLHRINPKDVKVFCLPGAEAIEIFSIYDKLEIPRKNIVCVERVKEHYETIKSQNLGVQLHHTTVKEYFESHPNEKFHIISLDYMGMLYKHIDDFRALTKNKNMADECVVFTNFCGAREKTEAKAFYMQYMGAYSNDMGELRQKTARIIRSELQRNGSLNYLEVVGCEELGLIKLKREQIEDTKKRLRELEAESDTPEHKEKIEVYKILLENFANNDGLNNQLELYLWNHMEHIIHVLFRLKFDVETRDMEGGEKTRFYYSYRTDTKKISDVDKESYMPAEAACSVMRIAAEDHFGGEHHRVHDVRSCRYVGYSGIPMLCDMFYLKREKPFDTLKGYLNDKGETFAEIFFPFFNKLPALEIKKLVTKCKDILLNRPTIKIPNRECLGYESKVNPRPEGDYSEEYDLEIIEAEITSEPVTEKAVSLNVDTDKSHNFKMEEKIKKARIMMLANPEMTSYEIAERTGAKITTVAALMAHRTRGTYDDFDPDEYGETG